MMSSLSNYDKLKGELNRIFIEGINLDDDVFLNCLWSDVKSPKDVLELAKKLKGEGNSLFKQQEIGDALETYGYAEVLLARGRFVTDEDKVAFSELALCILLNITACLSKERDFVQVGQLCSVVLDFNPNNVKVLFRRATAALELGKPQWAYWDLRTAVELQPRNQEVFKKFEEVKSTLYNENSTDSAHNFSPIGLGSKLPSPKRNVRVSSSVGNENTCKSKVQGESDLSLRSIVEKQDLSSRNDMGSKDKEDVLEVREEKMNEREIHLKSSQTSIQAEPIYRFDNRKRSGSSISISGKNYELLMKGKTIRCFNSKLGTPMTICLKDPKDVSNKKDSSSREVMEMVGHLDQGEEEDKRTNSVGENAKGMECEGESISRDEWELLPISSKSKVSGFQFTAKRKQDENFNSKQSDKLKVLKRKSSYPLPKKTTDLAFTPFSSSWCFDFCRFQGGRKRKLECSPDSVQCPRKKLFVKPCNSVILDDTESRNSVSCSNEVNGLVLGGYVDGATQDVVFDHKIG